MVAAHMVIMVLEVPRLLGLKVITQEVVPLRS